MTCIERLRPSLTKEQEARYQPIKEGVAKVLDGSVTGKDREMIFSEIGEFLGHSIGFLNERYINSFTSTDYRVLQQEHDLVCKILLRAGSCSGVRWAVEEELIPALNALHDGTATEEQRHKISEFFK